MDRRNTAREPANRRPSSRQESGRQSRPDYDGRFGSSDDVGRKRPTGSYRSQPSGSYRSRMGYEEGSTRRPSVRGSADSYTRRPEPRPPKKPAKRKAGKRVNPLMLVLVVLAMLVLAALIVLVITSMGQTYHRLPTVERL